jgi:hypothetical protein
MHVCVCEREREREIMTHPSIITTPRNMGPGNIKLSNFLRDTFPEYLGDATRMKLIF